MRFNHCPELFGALLCLGLGMASGLGMEVGPESWYGQLHRPVFNPPNGIFGPVWTLLYIALGVTLGKIWTTRSENPWLFRLFILQLALNMAWSPLFFRCHTIGWALGDLALLWSITVVLLVMVRQNRMLFLLLVPYWAWITFAALLNQQFYALNPGQRWLSSQNVTRAKATTQAIDQWSPSLSHTHSIPP